MKMKSTEMYYIYFSSFEILLYTYGSILFLSSEDFLQKLNAFLKTIDTAFSLSMVSIVAWNLFCNLPKDFSAHIYTVGFSNMRPI